MTDTGKDLETRTGKLYQAYGLDGGFAESFDLEELRRLFEARHGYPAKEAMVTAGGGTALVGPLKGVDTTDTYEQRLLSGTHTAPCP